MSWYDFFSRFYDRSLEEVYLDARAAAVEALELSPGMKVLDLPCGTGQSFDGLCAAVGPEGVVVGGDLSEGMLAKAQARVDRLGLGQVRLARADVREVDAAWLHAALGEEGLVDRLHIFLGLTAFDEWDAAFERLWSLLAPGGRCVVVDVHAAKPGFQGKMVNLVARADIRREVFRALETRAEGYARLVLEGRKEYGGELYVVSGNKGAA